MPGKGWPVSGVTVKGTGLFDPTSYRSMTTVSRPPVSTMRSPSRPPVRRTLPVVASRPVTVTVATPPSSPAGTGTNVALSGRPGARYGQAETSTAPRETPTGLTARTE